MTTLSHSMPDIIAEFTVQKIPVRVYSTRESAEEDTANMVTEHIQAACRDETGCVLGLATGKSLTGIYRALVKRHQEGCSFKHAETFNLDEYYPIDLKNPQSFHRYMHEHLFDQLDIPPDRRHVPDGSITEDRIEAHCREYEQRIRDAGGIDLQLLGLGRNGHVGFNEPGSTATSRTRRVRLHPWTREDNQRDFGDSPVPLEAITMGIATICEARSILLLAFGERKARALRETLLEPVNVEIPATQLRGHAHLTVFADREAARELLEHRDVASQPVSN